MANWKPLDQMSILGKYYPRIEAAEKVTGRAKYIYDQAPEGSFHFGNAIVVQAEPQRNAEAQWDSESYDGHPWENAFTPEYQVQYNDKRRQTCDAQLRRE